MANLGLPWVLHRAATVAVPNPDLCTLLLSKRANPNKVDLRNMTASGMLSHAASDDMA